MKVNSGIIFLQILIILLLTHRYASAYLPHELVLAIGGWKTLSYYSVRSQVAPSRSRLGFHQAASSLPEPKLAARAGLDRLESAWTGLNWFEMTWTGWEVITEFSKRSIWSFGTSRFQPVQENGWEGGWSQSAMAWNDWLWALIYTDYSQIRTHNLCVRMTVILSILPNHHANQLIFTITWSDGPTKLIDGSSHEIQQQIRAWHLQIKP